MKIILTLQDQSIPRGYRSTLNRLTRKGINVQYRTVPPAFSEHEILPITRYVSGDRVIVEHGFQEGLSLIREIDSGACH